VATAASPPGTRLSLLRWSWRGASLPWGQGHPLPRPLFSLSYSPRNPSRRHGSPHRRHCYSPSSRRNGGGGQWPSGVAAAAPEGVLLRQSRPCSHGVSAVEVGVLSRCVSLSLSLSLSLSQIGLCRFQVCRPATVRLKPIPLVRTTAFLCPSPSNPAARVHVRSVSESCFVHV
jgi:hypothetical protein